MKDDLTALADELAEAARHKSYWSVDDALLAKQNIKVIKPKNKGIRLNHTMFTPPISNNNEDF